MTDHPPSEKTQAALLDEEFEYDAFISYSRKDTAVAEALERALERYRAPSGLGVHTRHLTIFRDVSDFTGSDYQAAVEHHLGRARHLIVLCSPAARASQYVDDEIARFAAARTPERIIPVLVDGIPNNEATLGTEAQAAFPQQLCTAVDMPLAIPFEDFDPSRDRIRRGRFEASWYTLLANLYGVSRADVERRDHKRRRKQLITAVATTAIVILGLATLSVIALIQRDAARRAQRVAEDRAAVALAGSIIDRSLESAALLLLEVDQPEDSDEALAVLAEVATARGGWIEIAQWSAPGATGLAFSTDGEVLRVSGPDSTGSHDPWSGAGMALSDASIQFPPTLHSTDPAGRRRVEETESVSPLLVDDARGDTVARLRTDHCVDRLFFGPQGRMVVGDCMAGGEIGIWDTETGDRTALLPGRVFGPRSMDASGERLVAGPAYSMGSRGRGVGIDLIELTKGNRTTTLELNGQVQAYAISPDGRRIAAVSTTGEVRVWSDEGSGLESGLPGSDDRSAKLVALPGSPTWELLVDDPDHWSLQTVGGGADSISLRPPRPGAGWWPPSDSLRPDPVFDGDADAVFARGDGGRSRVAPDPMAWVWDIAGGEVLLEIPGEIRLVAFHPARDMMATLKMRLYAEAGDPGVLTLWNHEAGTRIAEIPDVAAVGMAFEADGAHLVLETPEGGRLYLAVSASALQGRLRARFQNCLSPEERQRLLGESVADARSSASACRRCLGAAEADWLRVRQGLVAAEGPWAAFRSCQIGD